MTNRPFRFGVSLLATGSRSTWQARARQAEDLGYDTLQVPDHLGMPAPFPALVSVAEATSLTVGTYVLNAGFYRPALLARDVADTALLTDGRLEVGLGTGAIAAEFEAAGVPFPSGGARVEGLARTVAEMKQALAAVGVPVPPLLLAGDGDRMLRLAAREADIVGLSLLSATRPGADPAKVLDDRVSFVRMAAGDRLSALQLNLFVSTVSVSGEVDLSFARAAAPDLPEEHLLSLPGVLVGSARTIADRLLDYRETHGITYLSVLEPAMQEFGKVIELLR
ncbi:TIGR03621 family F420-dependent LLM class oxidoreductase [Amycolatopsis sp. NPDC050768]|uniref:TIGR03621 family F420-dependent LLM class oxidoreductase n=1 Tax=Amycolatopsis sp. NPDC050768 TaxID=3154839 RepID=UPI0034005437